MMSSKVVFWLIWITFILYSAFLAPRDDKATRSTSVYVKQLAFGPFDGLDSYVIALFYLMGIDQSMFSKQILRTKFFDLLLGVWPLIYLTMLLIDGQNQRLNGTLTALLANFLGAFIILPYFALRRSEKAKEFRSNIFIRIFESKITSFFLLVATLGLCGFGLSSGKFEDFLHEFRTSFFIHVMTIDFFVISFIFPFLIVDDLKRRSNSSAEQIGSNFRLCFIPMFGPLIYFLRREPLKKIKV